MPTQTAANRKLISNLRKLATRLRTEADQCEQSAAALEAGDAGTPAASGRGGRRAAGASANGAVRTTRAAKPRATAPKSAAPKRAAAKAPRAGGRAERGPTTRQAAIVTLLNSDPTRVWTPREIAAQTGLNASSVRTFLQMLVSQSAIARVGTGRYQSTAGATKRRGRAPRAAK